MSGTLAVVAAATTASEATTAELRALGAGSIDVRSIGSDKCLVYGSFEGDDQARLVVAALREAGWAAAQRPTDDDPRILGWRNRSEPVAIAGGRLFLCLPWSEILRNGKTVLEIDPGAAFGSGNHPTTRLLLEELAARLTGGETVLDVGCGSGALALAAIRFGAASAVGVDVEEAAVRATRANAERNRLADRVTALATPLQELPGSFDVIVANIGKEVLAALAAHIEARLAPNGWIALSGISAAQVSTLSTSFQRTRVIATPQLDDWCAIVGQAQTSSH